MQNFPEAFLLLALPDASLTAGGKTENGTLSLNCVTMPHPEAINNQQRDVYLVLRANSSEIPLDPARIITRTDTPAFRSYTFAAIELDPTEILLRVKVQAGRINSELPEKLETFESILEQYALDFRRPSASGGSVSYPNPPDTKSKMPIPAIGVTRGEKDFRGRLVMINEETGEIIGEIQDNLQIHEDPSMYKSGHLNDPVIIEVPEETPRQSDANALQAFARLVPPDQQDWITKSASIFSQAISKTTNLLVTTISTATDYYVSHSSPSPHHSSASATNSAGTGPNPASSSRAGSDPPPLPPRPRVLVVLTSGQTRKGLTAVHAVSGEAVKMSSKTLNAIDNMIRRAMGMKNRRNKYFASPSDQGGPGAASLAAPLPPPPYETIEKSRTPSPQFPSEKLKPPVLPPRSSLSPVAGYPPPLPPRSLPGPSSSPQPSTAFPHQPILTSKERMLISLDLILSTVDDSVRRLLDTGPSAVGKVMDHKYGPEAAHASVLLTGTARNVGLVYVDLSGMGRRALLKRAGRTFVKSRLSNNTSNS